MAIDNEKDKASLPTGCENHDEVNHDEDNHVPRDKGWAWMVLAGSTIELMIIIGMLKSSGILFVELQKRFQSTSGVTSLISTIQNAVFSVCSLLVMNLGLRVFTCRTALFIGGCIICASFIITSRAHSINIVMFSHGVLQGIGQSFIQPCTTVMVSRYFKKRRGFANSMAVSGGSIGGLVFAPVLTALFEHYGFSGAFLIASGFYLNSCVVGALYRPESFYTNLKSQRSSKLRSVLSKTCVPLKRTDAEHVHNKSSEKINVPSLSAQRFITEIDYDTCTTQWPLVEEESCNGCVIARHQCSLVGEQVEDRGDMTCESTVLMNDKNRIVNDQVNLCENYSLSQASKNVIIEKANTSSCKENVNQFYFGLKTFMTLLDIRLFKQPVFVVFIISAGLLCSSCSLISVYIAPHVTEQGLEPRDIATLLIIIAALDFVSRSMSGVIADKKIIRTSSIIGIATISLGLIANLIGFLNGFAAFAFFAVCVGLFGGVYFAVFPVVIVEYMTIDKLHSCLGFTTLFHGGSAAASFALIGILRDSTGSYDIPFHFLGAQMITGGVLMMLLPVVDKLHKKKSQQT